MKGSSGATLEFEGDFLLKKCSDAERQCAWFDKANSLPVAFGVRYPKTFFSGSGEYRIEFIEGMCGTLIESTRVLDIILDQILLWRDVPAANPSNWGSYLERLLQEHVSCARSSVVEETYNLILKSPPLPSSFCHGDLTLENVIVEPCGSVVLIDPNFKENLFQSYILDLGKLLQSVHSDYHRLFNSHPGADPEPLCKHLKARLGPRLWKAALLAEMSHVIRLRRYRPPEQRGEVDRLLQRLTQEWQTGD